MYIPVTCYLPPKNVNEMDLYKQLYSSFDISFYTVVLSNLFFFDINPAYNHFSSYSSFDVAHIAQININRQLIFAWRNAERSNRSFYDNITCILSLCSDTH